MQGDLFDDHRPPEPDPRPTPEDLEQAARHDVVTGGLEELGLAEGATLERPPAIGHVLIHAQVDGATEPELRELAKILKARAEELGASHVATVVQPPPRPRA